ncbi:HetP family heterocyst commitment protein [Cronbergia sp. UHCC 0137]|uniref:HetP family heterocyst commitment protein n=1 Tax=Cronbergia sp. UHCC 0137 TaxID=3110239 RepID=UPI002B203037|nr:HetP family heterocyst commitment protein [Cronbergia sp. UHCC 0137]MEA5620117.1 HetP family heterocyst commitment protein [Cronbergia sp. UHCC 0137]
MNYHTSPLQKSVQHPITSEQLNQVIAAITEGRYSWACVLILRFVGYNPLHFIPQRTYSRLMKEYRQIANSSNHQNPSPSVSKINDLEYLEISNKKQASLRGGNTAIYWQSIKTS